MNKCELNLSIVINFNLMKYNNQQSKNFRRLLLLSLLFSIIAVLPVSGQVDLTEGLVAWYPFEKGTEDASGNENHSDNHKANRERDVEGTRNGSYRFSNDKDHILTPVDINIGAMPQVALCAWVYPFRNRDEITVVSNDDEGGDRKIFSVKKDNRYVWAISDGKGNAIGEVPVERKEWVFLVANYDEKSKYASIYVNGHKTLGKTAMDMGSDMAVIGSNAHDNEDFEAIIDEVRIYNRLLNAEEIDSLMALKNPKPLHKKSAEKEYYYLPEQDNLIVRGAPSREAKNIGTINATDTLRYTETVPAKGGKWKEWLKIDHNGQAGFVSLKYLDQRTADKDEMSQVEAFMDEKMSWGNWQYWAIIGGALLIAILGIVKFNTIDYKLAQMTGGSYSGSPYFPIIAGVSAVVMAIVLVLWQTPVEYYFGENFTLWPYGYGFGTWSAWFVMALVGVTFLVMVIESVFSTNPVHALLRIILLTLLAGLLFIPVMIITLALIVVMMVVFFIGIILSGIGGYRYVVYR
jgi:hypothetical protein